MELRYWLILICLLAIIAIFFDGWRRWKKGPKYKGTFTRTPEVLSDFPSAELPSGGARVRVATEEELEQSTENLMPERLNLHEKVPLLMDTLLPKEDEPEQPVAETEPSPQQELELPDAAEQSDEIQDEFDFGVVDEDADLREPTLSFGEFESDIDDIDETGTMMSDDDEADSQLKRDVFDSGPQMDVQDPAEIIVINVMPDGKDGFEGEQLLQILLACGMRFGSMDIFHRTDDQGRIQFSMARAFQPGTFDLDSIAGEWIGGLTFFMTLPCSSNALESFDYMYETANVIARHMNGKLLDEIHSAMTTQTVEHCRSRIREFARSQLINA